MPVPIGVWIALRLASPAGVAAARWASRQNEGGPVGQLPGYVWDRLTDPDESDADLEAMLTALPASVPWTVTTFDDPFELRKLHVLFGRASGAATPEDDAICTYHFLKLAAGAPTDAWVDADFIGVETAFDTFWNALKAKWSPDLRLKQYRWYATGPQLDATLGAPGRTGPPRRVVERNLPGTSAPAIVYPPQVAVSITEQTTDKKAWGRFYLPHGVAAAIGSSLGRIAAANQTLFGDAADAFYEACATQSTPVVVYSPAKLARETAGGAPLPARAARALTVDQIQIDDILDVIRSRRWNSPLLRLQRQVGA